MDGSLIGFGASCNSFACRPGVATNPRYMCTDYDNVTRGQAPHGVTKILLLVNNPSQLLAYLLHSRESDYWST